MKYGARRDCRAGEIKATESAFWRAGGGRNRRPRDTTAPTGVNLRTDHLLMADSAPVANEQGHSVLQLRHHRFSRDPLADIRRTIPQPGATCLAAGHEGDNLLVHQLYIAQIQLQISA